MTPYLKARLALLGIKLRRRRDGWYWVDYDGARGPWPTKGSAARNASLNS